VGVGIDAMCAVSFLALLLYSLFRILVIIKLMMLARAYHHCGRMCLVAVSQKTITAGMIFKDMIQFRRILMAGC